MKNIIQFFRHKDASTWPNPRDSIGNPVGSSPDGNGTYWTLKGPARDVWNDLRRNIHECIDEGTPEYGLAFIKVEMYMFGCNEATASPQIVICSENKTVRGQVFKAIEKSGIMDQQPTIALRQMPNLPKLKTKPLSQDDIKSDLMPHSNGINEIVVFTRPRDKPFGRRLFIRKQDPRQDGYFYRAATAGPILYINGKIYQLTVGHAFMDSGDFPLPQAESEDWELGEIDNWEETQNDSYDTHLGLAGESGGGVSRYKLLEPSPSATQRPSIAETARQPSLDSGVDIARDDAPTSHDGTVPWKLDLLGRLAWLPDSSDANSPDYALLELEEAYHEGSNEVPCAPNGSQRLLQVLRAAENGPRDVSVITMTASSGFTAGNLCATASYVRFPGQRTFQELYPVLLDGNLADGDCGSGVVDRATGVLYGHIVAGTAGTGLAYIVPVEHVFRDIRVKMGGDVSLINPARILEAPEDQLNFSKFFKAEYSKRGDPLRVVEFASPGYIRKLQQPAQHKRIEDEVLSAPKSTLPAIVPDERQEAGPSNGRSINRDRPLAQKQLYSKSNVTHQSNAAPLLQESFLNPRLLTTNKVTKSKGKKNGDPIERKTSTNLLFEEHFFALPIELRDHVIGYLSVPDFLSLRFVSKSWHELISINETSISRAFLENNPVPRFVRGLYPRPAPADLKLRYVYGIWHRLSVTSKMARLMAKWIMTDMFLRKDATQQQEFLPQQARIRRRLIPILFTLYHFFTVYPRLHLKYLLDNDHPVLPPGLQFDPVARKIMNIYDNETLLQVTQVFPFLDKYIHRTLRPPSYFGRLEKSLHGYVRRSLPEYVHVGILCIGGLREATRILKIESYDDRMTAVDDWYSAVFQQPIDYSTEKNRWPLAFGAKKFKRATSHTAVDEPNINTSTSTSNKPLTSQVDTLDKAIRSKAKGKQKAVSNSSSSPWMQPLTGKNAQLLLKDLPTLEQLWIPTSEALLVARCVIDRSQDIKRKGQAMHELVIDEFTAADGLFYGCTERDLNEENVWLGWGDLLNVDANEMAN